LEFAKKFFDHKLENFYEYYLSEFLSINDYVKIEDFFTLIEKLKEKDPKLINDLVEVNCGLFPFFKKIILINLTNLVLIKFMRIFKIERRKPTKFF